MSSFHVASVALSDIYFRFAWQAWHSVTYTFVLRGRHGTWRHPPSFCVAGVALAHIHFRFAWLVWQESHLLTSIFVLHGWCGRCGTWSHSPSFCVAGVALVLSCWFLVATRHLSHTPSFTHHLCHTQLSHTIFVTHHLSHSIFVTHHLSHTTLSHTIFHTLSFTVLVSCSSALIVLAQAEIANNKPACSSIVSPVEVAVA